jgi:hypothetical protein
MSHTEENQDKVLNTNDPETLVETAEKDSATTVSQSPVQNTTNNTALENQHLPENVGILKEAFPDTDVDVIEAVLQAQNGNVESSFELLLGISDPNYSATPVEATPTMPPRPQQPSEVGGAPYAYWERQAQPEPRSVEEQLRLDEELAKKLALEDQQRSEQRKVDARCKSSLILIK